MTTERDYDSYEVEIRVKVDNMIAEFMEAKQGDRADVNREQLEEEVEDGIQT